MKRLFLSLVLLLPLVFFASSTSLNAQDAATFKARAAALFAKGEYDKVIADCNQALRLNPNNTVAYEFRGSAWDNKGEYEKAIADYREAINSNPNYAGGHSSLAWLQATCPEERYRDGKAAFANANMAYQLDFGENYRSIDVLAAAYAENGDFEKAREWQAKALALAETNKAVEEKNKQEMRSRLELYKQGKPHREVLKKTSHFKMTIASQLTMTIEGQKQEVIADTTLYYVNRRRGREVWVQFEELSLNASNNGHELMNVTVSATGVTNVKDGQSKEVRAADAPEEVKMALLGSFEKPICVVELDADGAETKRTVSDDLGAKAVIDNGLVAGARLFHAPFPANKSKWQANREVSMGGGNYVRGKLAYEKISESFPGQTTVKVSGELRFTPASSPATIKQARYRVEGEQVYDAARSEWTAGTLVIKVAMDLENPADTTGVGTMTVVLRLLADK